MVWVYVDVIMELYRSEEFSVVIINVFGCGIIVKDYVFMLRENKEIVDDVNIVLSFVVDISEFVVNLDLNLLVDWMF